MNKRIKYSDSEIATKTQYYFLKIAGFVIKIVLEPAEQIIFKRNMIEDIIDTWGKGGFLKVSSSAKIDFEIKFESSAEKMGILEKRNGKDHYYLVIRRNISSKQVVVFYFTSLPTLQILLKEILSLLLEKDGFLLHASSCQDKKGKLKLFVASSGGGKTTTANSLAKSKACFKFGDDIVIVRNIKGKWFYFSPPFIEKDALPIKRLANKAEVYFVKKTKTPSIKELKDKSIVLKEILRQTWVSSGKLKNETLTRVISFVMENRFYLLGATLNAKAMQKLIYEN